VQREEGKSVEISGTQSRIENSEPGGRLRQPHARSVRLDQLHQRFSQNWANSIDFQRLETDLRTAAKENSLAKGSTRGFKRALRISSTPRIELTGMALKL
jgi:hypothetical protein